MKSLKGKTLVITGASRGVGREIALRAAKDGANVVILAKTAEPHPKLPGTIYTVAEEVERLGGRALPIAVDVRFKDRVFSAMEESAATFGGIDILVNNASAVILHPTEKQILLMGQVITSGTCSCTEACLPYLQKSKNPHVLTIAPPLPMAEHWIKTYGAYAEAKLAVSEYTKLMSKLSFTAFNTLWPKCMVYTAATINLFGEEKAKQHTRHPRIMADAAHLILTSESHTCTGNFFTDEDVLRANGVIDFEQYLMTPESELYPDIFI